MRSVRGSSSDVNDGESLARQWLAADPVPPEIAGAAKAAFARGRRPVPVLPLTLEIRGGDGDDLTVDPPSDLLVFSGEGTTIEVQVGVSDGAIFLRCTFTADGPDPLAVTAESPNGSSPMLRSDAGDYRTDGLAHGPLRVTIEHAGEPARSLATSWFTP